MLTDLNLSLNDSFEILETEFDIAERDYATKFATQENDHCFEEEAEFTADSELQDTSSNSVELETSFSDEKEIQKVDQFLADSCKCQQGPKGTPCSTALSKELISTTRNDCHQLTRNELDLAVMAQINALRTRASDQDHELHDNSKFRANMLFFIHGIPICQTTFLFLHTISRTRYYNLCGSVTANGLCDRVHGNVRKRPHNAYPLSTIQHVSSFITNMAVTHGLPLPGRLPGCEDKALLLPSDMPKSKVYRDYEVVCQQENLQPVKRSTFYKAWQDLHLSIGTMKPSSDLCFECQQYMGRIMRSSHLSEDEKSLRLREAEDHLALARSERAWYNGQIEKCKGLLKESASGSNSEYIHVSFDYAQQIHYPNNPQQPGPAYFLTARKCQLFGVACEPLGYQMNYLIDEAEVIGKGANATISLLRHYLEVHGMKVSHLLLHADNCIGQNKNNAFIHYMMWRVATGRNQSIQLSFMLAGHTKFAPDRHFGLIKKLYRCTRVDTIACLLRLVEKSSICGANKAQLIRELDGSTAVYFYDWVEFLKSKYKPVPSITSYHVFTVRNAKPDVISLQVHSNGEEKHLSIEKTRPSTDRLPQELHTKGLDLERQWYLYEKIRPFCSSNLAADLTCPKPSLSKPRSQVDRGEDEDNTSTATSSESATKRKRTVTCSCCGQEGHTKRTCPSK